VNVDHVQSLDYTTQQPQQHRQSSYEQQQQQPQHRTCSHKNPVLEYSLSKSERSIQTTTTFDILFLTNIINNRCSQFLISVDNFVL
jgi:hypothetical protein